MGAFVGDKNFSVIKMHGTTIKISTRLHGVTSCKVFYFFRTLLVGMYISLSTVSTASKQQSL